MANFIAMLRKENPMTPKCAKLIQEKEELEALCRKQLITVMGESRLLEINLILMSILPRRNQNDTNTQ
jgi:hypothetical protein